MICSASSNRATRWSAGKPNARYSGSYQPVPRPKTRRPPLTPSAVTAIFASSAGLRAADIPAQDVGQVDLRYTPLSRAQHESRYLRQELIKAYQARHGCRLVVMIDQIDPDSATLFAELLHGADPGLDLHLLLRSPGGDGEVAVRLARMAQAASRRFVVVVPDIAKS